MTNNQNGINFTAAFYIESLPGCDTSCDEKVTGRVRINGVPYDMKLEMGEVLHGIYVKGFSQNELSHGCQEYYFEFIGPQTSYAYPRIGSLILSENDDDCGGISYIERQLTVESIVAAWIMGFVLPIVALVVLIIFLVVIFIVAFLPGIKVIKKKNSNLQKFRSKMSKKDKEREKKKKVVSANDYEDDEQNTNADFEMYNKNDEPSANDYEDDEQNTNMYKNDEPSAPVVRAPPRRNPPPRNQSYAY